MEPEYKLKSYDFSIGIEIGNYSFKSAYNFND